jgi:AraC-like DNA-binding protein
MQRHASSLPPENELLKLAAEARWKVSALSGKLNISTRQLERLFFRCLEVSPRQWMDSQRSGIASQRLMNREQAKLVASELGFTSPSHFSRWFKHQKSQTATEFLTKAGLQRMSATAAGAAAGNP